MASRRQKQFDRKYSSFKRYTATEDVNYSSHSSKSSYRSESLTSRSDSRGRSTHFEVVAGSDTRSFPVYIAIQDYQPDASEVEGIALEQGQIVEVLDKKNAARWLVRTKARPPQSGWVPGSYFETPTEYYKQRRKTREIEHPSANLSEEQEAILKRDQVYHDLLRSEEEFVTDLRVCIDEFVNPLNDSSIPDEVQKYKEILKTNLTELYQFHANVMLKGLNYYSDDPGKVGQTFVRLEHDFDQHVQFYKDLPTLLEKLENPPIKEYFESLADKCEAGARSYADHLKNVADRMTHYQNYFKEFVKYSARANVSTKSMQKALELCICVPQRVNDLVYTDNIKEYPGDTNKLGRLIRHDMFKVEEGEGNPPNERYVFLFNNKVMITEKLYTEPVSYKHYATIRLDKYSVRTHSISEDVIILKPNEQGLPSFTLTPTDVSQAEFVRKAWLRDIAEEHEEYAQNHEHNTDMDITISEAPSNLNDYSSHSRKSSTMTGPEEGGPPRKKIKSPPVISPTGSTTSIYSGGSSSIDWATTGTTLEMQGTRVTRTQYGFRTLQESSAKMCLKVTGYPLPEITWYKDDVQLNEDERHKFYADEDGFFAMTIDPVQVEDTGRYTCMATNEYGQASTSAFFRVLKVEKEAAPPAFVNNLKDQECKEGEVVNFECEVEGWPEPELVWLVDDQPLRPSHDFKPSYDGQYAKLEIRDAQPDDTGVYTVKIQNEFGSAESKAELVVQADPDKNHVAPEFQQMIDDIECNEGDEVKFKAVITGDPNPEITWMINGIPLSESEKIRFISEDGICILIIKDVTRHFDGIVTCQGTNRLGQATCDGRLKVRIPPTPPTFNKLLEDKVVQEKGQAVFEVDVNGWPEPTLVFTLKGKELKHGEGGVDIQGADGFYRLTISDCSIEDHDGEIVAKATNEHGSAESRARLTVEQPEEESRSAPTFIKDIEDQTVKSGQQAVFETTVRGNPNPEVTWYINGHKMDESSPGIKIEVVNHDHKLTIDSAQYAGTVLCRAENSVGRFETKARLIVLPQETPKKPPQFTEKLVDKTETEQNTVVFEARVEAEPKADLKWYLNGQELTQSERVEIREFDGSVKLELRNLTLADSGEVKCVATNSEGSAETTAKLLVNKKPFGPRFDETPKSVTVMKGEEAVFRAHAEGMPEPDYQWSIDGRKIRASTDGGSVQIENGVSVLRLNTSIFSASSTISVVAENSVGNDETGCRLTVEEKPNEAADLVNKKKNEEQKEEVAQVENATCSEIAAEAELTTVNASIESVIEISSIEHSSSLEESSTTKKLDDVQAVVKTDTTPSEVLEEKVTETAETLTAVTEQDEQEKLETVETIPAQAVSNNADSAPTIEDDVKSNEEVKADESEQQVMPTSADELKMDDQENKNTEEPSVSNQEGNDQNNTSEDSKEQVTTTPEAKPSPAEEEKVTPEEMKNLTEEMKTTPEEKPSTAEDEKVTPEEVKPLIEEMKSTSEEKPSSAEDKKVTPEEVKPLIEEMKDTSEEKPNSAEDKKVTSEEVVNIPEEVKNKPAEVKIIIEEVKDVPEEIINIPEESNETKSTKTDSTGDDEADKNEKEEEATEKIPEVIKPVITRDLKSQTVNKGDIAHFEVVIENATEIHWFHNGNEVFDNNKDINLSNDDKFEFRLSLDSNTFSNGTISVTASNSSGSVTTKCEMKVLEELRETKKPEFTDALRDLEVVRDDSFRLDVIALHSPKYKWYINGMEVEDGKDGVKIINEENKSTLLVDKASDFHDGKVTVVASNEVGSTESSCRVSVVQKSTPPVVNEIYSKEVKEGESVEFKTTVTGYPEPTVQWTLNEQVITESEKITITKTNTEYTLSIRETVTSQQGTVKIRAQNSAGSDEKTSTLKVTQVIKAPQFSAQLSDRSVDSGEPLRFDVKLNEPSPGTDVIWLLNGSELKPGDNCQIVDHGDGSYHLTIPEAKPEHNQAVITCKAVNPAGTSETSAKIEVRSAKKKPEFIQKPQNHDTYIDESVKFSAIIAGLPTPQVSWYLNGKKLEHSDEVKVKYDVETGKTSIRIYKPQESQSGEIKVVVENELGSVEALATLKVERKMDVPKFVSNMDDRQVNEGDNISYTANVEGFPEPEVVWTLNGEPVTNHPNIKVTDENGQHTIDISSITPEQSGELSCQASNAVGLKKQNVQLVVKMVGEAPMFTKNLEDRLVTETETTFMEAKLKQVKPKPVVKWFRDGKELTADDHWKIEEHEDGTLQLKIVTTSMEDKGRITITAENHFGSAECAASLGVVKGRPLAKPAFQSNIAPISLTEGDSLQTKLLITGDPTPFVKWYINGQLVCETEDTEIRNSNGVYSLTIHGVTADMTGKIKCVAYNKAGEVSTEGDLKVIAPVPVEFETCLCDATCREGDTLKLKAVLLGEPTPVVSWYVNGKKLVETQNIKIHAEKGTYTVTIKDITCDYSGKVVCEAVNEYGTASSEAMLLVLPRGEPPDFLEWLTNVRARKDSQVVHKVVFTGDPKPVLTWYIHNEVVVPNENITIVTDDKTSVLTIKKFNPDVHVGEIICKAENEAGEVSCTANMRTYSSDILSESDSDRQTDCKNGDSEFEDDSLREESHRTPTPVMAPKFITKIKDASAKKGHSAIFECVVPDTKGVCCKWLKDGKEIELIARIRVTPRSIDGFTTHELILDDIQPEDAGKYTVIVENSAGRDVCEATLTVLETLEKPADRAPDFSVQLQDKKVSTSDKVLFECKVDGQPAPSVVWYHDTVKIEQSSRITIESTSEGVQRLSISSTEIKDEGSYSCVAENSAGTAKTEAKLVVQAEAPTFTKKLEDKKLDIGEKLVLSCAVKGLPQPHVEFFRDTVRMTSTDRISVEHDATNTHWRLVITNVTKEEIQTTYKAVATNAAGEATSESRVTSKTEAPVFEQGLKKTSVREKDEIRMEVRVSGTEPEVKWQKDGKPVEPDANHELLRNPETGAYTLVVRQASLADAGNYTVQAVNPAGQAESSADASVEQALVAPYFEKELAETQVSLRESATLTVSVKGVPQPSVEWLKDGKPVQIDGQNVIQKAQEDGQHQLIIASARFEDAGSYKCRAVNPAGQATTEAKFAVVRDLRPPEFVEKLQPLEVKETETLRLTVRVTGSPEPDLHWFKDGQPLQIDDNHVILKKQPDGRVEIEIKDAQLSDCGSYSVQATNTAGQANSQAQMAVISDVVKPHFIEGLKTLDVEQGQDVRLQVHVEGFPEPDVVFCKDGVKINVDNQHMLERDSQGHHTLIIRGVSNSDIGSYTCTATNRGGSDQTIGELKIPKYSFEKTSEEEVQPFFEQPLTEQTVTEGETTVLTCRVNKESKAQIQWFKDDKPIEIDGHMVTEQMEDGTIKLTIQKTTGQDVGKYRCEAVNKAGKAETTAPLSLQYALQQQEQVNDESGQMEEMLVEQAPQTDSAKDSTAGSDRGAPEFIELLRSCTVQIGKQAVLKCRVKGEPRPKIKWSKDGKEVEMSARIRSEFKDDGTLLLTVDDAQQTDAGEYRCEAENEYGSAWTEGPIIVTREGAQQPDGGAPDFLQPVRPVVVTEGETAVLEGKISGDPRPTVKWYKNGEQLKEGDRIKIEDLPDGTQRLTIKDAKLSDQDEYRCEAGNEHGDVWSDVTLTVKEKADEGPVFQKELSAVAVIEGQPAHFEARVSGIPRPEVKWFKDDKEVIASTDIHLESKPDGTEALLIDHAKINDQGNFRIEATNPAGKASSSAPLTVQPDGDKLKLKEPLRDVSVEQGLKIRLSVEVEGKPKTVKWYKGADQVQSDNRITLGSVSDSQHYLEIQSSELNDASSYRVVLSTEKDSVESVCTVTVKEGKAHLPSFRKGLNDQEVPKGQPLVLEVEIDGKPKSVKWIGPNGPLTGEDLGNGKYRLTVPDFKDSDVGNYTVEAENEAGIVESRAKVAVKPSGDDDGKDKTKPEIVSGLIPTNVNQGETARFTVKTKGPVKKVTWYKNGKEVGPEDGVKPIDNGDGSYSLEIPNAQLDSAGDFRVAVANDAGEADSSAALTVKPSGGDDDGKDKTKPEIVSGLIPTTVDQGETARFTVKTKGPVKKVTWYKNGKEVGPEDGVKPIDNGDGSYSLEIPNAQLDSAGDFRVAVANDAGEADSSAALTVKPKAEIDDGKDKNKPEIVQGLIPTTVDQGETARFTIKTKGPVKKVTWYKNGKEVGPADGVKPIDNGDGSYGLEIPNAQMDAAGDFKVVVGNDAGEADSSAALTVKLPAEKPKIVKGLEDVVLPVGSPLKLEIQTSGSPKTVRWYKNGKEIAGSVAGQIELQKIDDNNYILTVPKSAVEDSGEYRVEVENDAGKAESKGKVEVEPKLTFLKPLKDLEVTEGDQAEFIVETNAKPRSVKWYKNGQEVTPDGAKLMVQSTGNTYKLTIPKTVRDDAGDFKVVLENSAGPVDSSAKLTVKRGKPPVPRIIKPLEDQVVAKGSPLVFEVKVDGEIDDVKWLKDAIPLTASDRIKIDKIDDQTYRLTIPSAEPSDAGLYTVEAVNPGGKATSEAKGEVDEKPEIVKGLTDTTVKVGDDDVFKVETSAPIRSVKWYKNGQEIAPSGHFEPKKIGPKKYELGINRAVLDDGATYRVVLSNAAGECDSSAQLTVIKPDILKILDGLKDVDVPEGTPAELKVRVEGKPKSVKWYKNGQEIKPTDDLKLVESPESGEYSLVIPSSKKSDGGAYRVELGNDNGEVSSGAVLHVKPAKQPSTECGAGFLTPLQDVEVEEGETLTLSCRVSGDPFPTIRWEKDGKEIKKDDRIAMREALDGTITLRIRDAKKSDIGQYRVYAENPLGSSTSACMASVKDKGEEPSKPRFIIPLKSVDAAPGDKREFNIKLRGCPKPQLEWLLNEEPLKFDDRVFVEDLGAGNYCLTILDIKDSDYGTLRCRAKNELGEDECQAELGKSTDRLGREKDDDRYPPRFNVPLWDRRIPVNDPMFIECHVDAKPTATIVWFKDGKILESSEEVEVRNSTDGACRVKIQQFTEKHCGVYKCEATNELGVADTLSTYSVEVPVIEEQVQKKEYAPKFNPGLEDRNVNAGQPVKLSCLVDAVPRAAVTWYKDGLPLRPSDKISIEYSEDGNCQLTIASTQESDAGAYRCVATNSHGSTNTSGLVNVKVPKQEVKKDGEEPFFTKGLVDIWTDRGDTFTMKCCVQGDPTPEIKWYRNGQLVRNGPRCVIEQLPDGTCQLTVKECTMSDEGIYRCEAENRHGKAKTQATAHVQMAIGKSDKLKLDEGQPPRFVVPLEDQTVVLGSSIELSCKVTGQPMPNVKWSKDGAPIWEESRHDWEIDEAKGTYQLKIKNATINDEGTYRCVATNESGSATTKAFIRIDDGSLSAASAPKSTPPRFTIALGDARAVEGQPLKFECKIEGFPLPELTWHKDGAQIQSSDRCQITLDEGGNAKLLIPACTMDDDGIYRVIATNPSGSARDKGTGTVKRAPKDTPSGLTKNEFDASKVPKLLQPLENVRVPEKEGFRLSCKFSGDPKPTIKWYKDGERVFAYGRLQLLEQDDGTCELIIDSSSRQDAGGYRCVAENSFGSVRTTCDVSVIRTSRFGSSSHSSGNYLSTSLSMSAVGPSSWTSSSSYHHRSSSPSTNYRSSSPSYVRSTSPYVSSSIRSSSPYLRSSSPISSSFNPLERSYSSSRGYGGFSSWYSGANDSDYDYSTKERKPRDLDSAMSSGKAPGFTIPLTIRRAKPGESVTFECLPFGQPFPSIKWLKDGIELVADEKISIEADADGTQKLTLKDINFFAEGYYRCVATNIHGTASTKAELVVEGDRSLPKKIVDENVEPEESKPRIRRGLHNMSIHQGNVVEMIVCATGWPTPTVKWFKDGQEIISDGPDGRRVIFTDERGVHHLVILNCEPGDEGEYSLEATNKLGSARTEGSLNVIRPRHPDDNDDRGGIPYPPGFVRQLKNKHVFNHMPTIFDCLVVGHPPPEVEWFHNGKRIVPDGRIKIQSCGGGSHAIIILDTTLEDAGEYVACAKNSHGTASSSAILDVTVPHLDNIKFDGSFDVSSYLTEEYGFKKVNYASLPTPPDHGPFIKEVTGHFLTLSWIPTKRAPPRYPQVTYVIEIRELPEKEWTLLDYNIPEPVCKVRNLELGKSYQFRVRAENIYGISDPSPASPPSRLMAPPQPVFDKRTQKVIPLLDPYAEKALDLAHAEQYACAPWFAPGVVEKRYCAENDSLTIILNVSGYPDPDIQWKFRGWNIDTTSPTSKCKVYTYGGTETTLSIMGFSKENVGQYQCFAKNNYGEAQQNIMVDLATRPSFIQPLSNKTFSSAHPMKLDVRVDGQPFPELKWMKDWRPIVESSRIKFVQDGPYLCSLIVNDPLWRDSGIYTCVAVNEAGQATTSCTVTVEADGDYNDVQLPKKRVAIEARKVREVYDIDEEDEKRAVSGAPFTVKERSTGLKFLAQLKPIDDSLNRSIDIHNVLEHPNVIQFKQVIKDNKIAMVVYDNSSNTILNDLAHPGVPMGGPTGQERERMVQIFIRYLVLALEHMHDLRIAHLDLRPETILLQDDRLKLADFGQSRRLLRGLITGQIQGTPEFVSPEIVRGYPLTLATDLWSVGTITYVLLTGQSPFHGDNDEETLANVDKVRYSLDGPEWSSFSSEARDFISKLLCEIPADRLTCKEALQHEWLSSKDVLTAPLPADGLREFNYTHKWLERRVFVQQTPSEQLLDAILAPSIALAQQADSKKPPRETDRPVELYDYLRIKPRPPPEIVDIPKRRIERTPYLDQYGNPIDEHYLNQPPPYAFNDPNYIEPFNPQAPSHPSDSRRNTAGVPQPPNIPIGHPQQREQRRIPLDQYGRLIRAEDLARIPHDQYGRPIDIDEKQFLSPEKLPRLDESKLRQILPPGHPGKSGFKGPHQDYPDDSQMTEKRKLEPQTKGETPSKSRRDQPKQQRDSDDSEDDNVQVPVRMVRGERRDIEEEIANRILSDISEEGSVAGSLGSLDDFEQVNTIRQKYTKKSRSRSSTPKAESDASTPTLSPVNTIKESNFFPDTTLDELPLHEKELLEQADNDPNIPIGAPLFLEGLHNNTLIIDTAPTPSPNLLTPKSPRRSVPGTKSPVLLSPGKEHSMEVLIATKRGKPSFLPPGEQAAEIDDEDAHMDDRKKKIKPTDHKDDFEDLKDDLTHRKKVDDLDKYRPSNFYKDDVDFNHPGYDIDDSPWDSHYQIGPDTYLMASRGPSFNSRVRDYRRNLWGDGAPLVRQGILGVRNGEVTVKERRRFTDILREHSHNLEPKSNERATSLQKAPSATNAIDRIRTDIQKVAPSATRRNADGTYAPIFITRMRDAYLGERSAVFECSVTGSPAPTVEWTFHNQVLTNDDKRTIEQNGNIHRLIIHKPLPFDLGEYLCTATNEFGSDKTTSRLISGEAPSRPGRPDAELSSDTEIFLTWEAPEGHTYLEGITYRLEYRPAGPDDVGAAWIVISENVDDEAVVVKHLQPFGIYQFRVTARNGFGLGLPSLSSRIIQTHGKGAAKLQIEILKSYVRLNVVSLPQKSANQLNEISEESESEDKTLQEQITKENIELQTDNVLSRFQIDALIYKGRFAVVRKAVDNSQEGSAHCIAKIRDINEESVLREYEILKDAQHENVQRLIAAYNREGFLYLFCEQLYENVFSRFVFNDYYTEEQVCLTIRQVASALHWLHFRGIAHLDINPHNVMFQSKRNWIVKLVDFGSAQKLSTAVKPKEFNVLWAAPEFHIDDVPVTVQSDVWGMGVITFCLLGGFHPFTSEYDEITEVKHNVLNVKCDPNLIPVNASQESLSFATWALKKSPMRRMRTDEALSHRFLSSDPSMVRRREAVKYSASRLRKTLFLTKQEQQRPTSDSLENKFGGPVIQ